MDEKESDGVETERDVGQIQDLARTFINSTTSQALSVDSP